VPQSVGFRRTSARRGGLAKGAFAFSTGLSSSERSMNIRRLLYRLPLKAETQSPFSL